MANLSLCAVLLLVVVLFTSGCSTKISDVNTPATHSPETRTPPVSGGKGDSVNEETSDDGSFKRALAAVEVVEIRRKESFPGQITLVVEGTLPTPCHQLRTKVHPPGEKNEINVEVYSLVDPAMICAQVLAPFEEQFELGSYPAGGYTVVVNGQERGRFEIH
ncbi:MAG: hypothetical protein IT308_01270 [Anaerolineaceae bacterium]|nr:hypothetical protein [Anaerolineaceae bacterium]